MCPYSLDRPGGVQLHVLELAEALIKRGHQVSVLAPAGDDTDVPDYVFSAGRSVPIRFNGSTARVTFGLVSAARVRLWLGEGDFDIVHLHEPGAASLALIAMWARVGPTVATFHTSNDDSRIMRLGKPWIKPGYEELDARIAVSPSAAATIREHLHIEATHVIPNGVDTSAFVNATPTLRWRGTPDAPTVGILGRMDEPRKGLDEFLAMIPITREQFPHSRFLVAGRFSDRVAARAARAGAEVIGELDEDAKASFMSSVDVYCAPNLGGESFGIVLVEAMAAGAAVTASDLTAFKDVAAAKGGGYAVELHKVGDPQDLARAVIELLGSPERRAELAERGRKVAAAFDWSNVAPRVEATYRDAIRMDAEFHPHPPKEDL